MPFVRVGMPHTEINTTLGRYGMTLYFYDGLFDENKRLFRADERLF
jgi:hypothetical protein